MAKIMNIGLGYIVHTKCSLGKKQSNVVTWVVYPKIETFVSA